MAGLRQGLIQGQGRRQGRSTPATLRVLLWVLVIASLAWGAVAAFTAERHASAAADVVAVSEPLSLDAQQIYQYLSDADATAANAFLAGGLEPAAKRQQYNQDITSAGLRIESASALVGATAARSTLPGHLSTQATATDIATGDDLSILTADLPVYASEVATANADNRLGLPLGGAYLREADTLLRGTLLTAASDINTRENALLTQASAQATGLPLITVTLVIGLAIGFLLIRSGRWLTSHTNRVINTGLAAALVLAIVGLAWLAGAFGIGRSNLLHAQQSGSTPALAYARADVAALRAHADESLTLIDDTGDDLYQKDFGQQEKVLGTLTGTAQADAQAWFTAHQHLRVLDNAGNHTQAVADAQQGDSAKAFQTLSGDLTSAVNSSQTVFASSARSGRDAFTGLAIGMIVVALLMAASCAWGLSRRLAEYR